MDLVKEESGYLYTWLIMTNVGIIGLVILHIFWNKLKGLGFTGDASRADANASASTADASNSSSSTVIKSNNNARIAAAVGAITSLTSKEAIKK
jgi:hypothetical protein